MRVGYACMFIGVSRRMLRVSVYCNVVLKKEKLGKTNFRMYGLFLLA